MLARMSKSPGGSRPGGVLPTRRAILTTAAGGVLLGGCGTGGWDEFSGAELTIATGNVGGVFHRYGEALATVLRRRLDGVTVRTRRTNASVVNVREVSGRVSDIGFSLADVAADARRGRGEWEEPVDLVALTRAYDSFVHLVVRADSDLRAVPDLRGRRVGLGAAGSGTRGISGHVLQSAGLTTEDVDPVTETLQRSADALADGGIDAFFFVSGLPNTAVLRLSRQLSIRLVPLDRIAPRLIRDHGPEFSRSAIPASTYGLPGPVETVSVKNYLLVRPDLDTDLAYAVTRVMFEEQAGVDALEEGVRQPNVGTAIYTSPLPLHDGALRYYREQRS